MGNVNNGYVFGPTEQVTADKLAAQFSGASVDGIVNADIDPAAGIVDTKLAQVTTAGKVSGTAIVNLNNLPAGAGVIPAANLPVAASILRGTFTNSDLSAGILTITHNKAQSSPYIVPVTILDNTGAQVIPDAVNTFATNSFKVDLTSYGTLTGTWSYAYAS